MKQAVQPIYIGVKDFALHSGIPVHTLKRLVRSGEIPSVNHGRRILIHRGILEEMSVREEKRNRCAQKGGQ